MRDNPIAMIESIAFIGFVIWLFIWQNKSSRPDRSEGAQTQQDAESERTLAKLSDDAGGRGDGP